MRKSPLFSLWFCLLNAPAARLFSSLAGDCFDRFSPSAFGFFFSSDPESCLCESSPAAHAQARTPGVADELLVL